MLPSPNKRDGFVLPRFEMPASVSQVAVKVFKVVLVMCVVLMFLEYFITRVLPTKGVHVYNLPDKLGEFLHVREPCYAPGREVQFAYLRKVLTVFNKASKEAGMSYWLEFGSLLGYTRDGKFIPFDSDIDIGVMKEEYFAKRAKLNAALKPYGFKMSRDVIGCKTRVDLIRTKNNTETVAYVFDVFLFATPTRLEAQAYYKKHGIKPPPSARTAKGSKSNFGSELVTRCDVWDHAFYTAPRWYTDNLQLANFEGLMVPVPSKAKEFIRLYRYPYNYWATMPYRLNCYIEPEFIWLPMTVGAVVAVLTLACCVLCPRCPGSKYVWKKRGMLSDTR